MGILDRFIKPQRKGGVALVVDDEPRIARVMATHLEHLDMDVVAAGSGREAVEILDRPEAAFNLFILDILMPGMNGMHLAKDIRQRPEYAKTPLLFVSGAFPPSQLEKVRREIPDAHWLTKPFRMDQFVETVRKALAPVKV